MFRPLLLSGRRRIVAFSGNTKTSACTWDVMRSREFRGITGVSVAYVRVNNKDFSLASRSALDAYSSYSVATRAPPHDHARTALAFDLRYRASVPTVRPATELSDAHSPWSRASGCARLSPGRLVGSQRPRVSAGRVRQFLAGQLWSKFANKPTISGQYRIQ